MYSKSFQKWEPIKLPGHISDTPYAHDLIGIELLTDYKLVKQESSGKVNYENANIKKPSKRKRGSSNTSSPPDKRKKRKNTFDVQDCDTPNEDSVSQIDPLEFLPWENIHVPKEIARALLDQGFKQPTEIQVKSIPAGIKGRRDLLGAAQTGSGKTLAFGIPIIYGIMKTLHLATEDSDVKGNIDVFASKKSEKLGEVLLSLILTPTRELAIQITRQLQIAAKYTPVKIAVIIGGMSNEKQERLLNKKPHIVVATPGRLWEFLSHPHLVEIEKIRFLAIDETDRMLEKEHFPELRSLLEKINLNSEARQYRQNFVFSATLSFVHDPPKHLKKKRQKIIKLTPVQKLQNIMDTLGITNPKIVDITPKTGTAEKLLECKLLCSLEDKDIYLYYFLLKHPGKTLVFCNSISCVRRLTSLFGLLKVKPLPIHSGMHQRQRLKNLDRFRENTSGLLVATDVAARGIDIPDVQYVIHFQVPRTYESYVHRSGRTARAENEGLTLLLIEPAEVKLYTKLCTSLNRSNDLPDLPVNEKIIKGLRNIMESAKVIDKLDLKFKKYTSDSTWEEKIAEKLDIILNEDISKPLLQEQLGVTKSRLKLKKKELSKMLGAIQMTFNEEMSAIKIMKSVDNKSNFKILKKK